MTIDIEKFGMVELAIVTGMYDEKLDQLASSIKRRQEILSTLKLNSLIVGQIITISAKVSPKLLARCPAEVVEFTDKGDAVRVRLLATRSHRWQYDQIITINKNLIGEN